jgi:hypothetical protein
MKKLVDAIWIRQRMQEKDLRFEREARAQLAKTYCADCLKARHVRVKLVDNVCQACGTEGPA